jgi:GntR family transcriptional regulator
MGFFLLSIFPLPPRCTSCNSTHVIPFRILLRPGTPISEQIVYAAKRAIVSGQLLPGDEFPSVRALSREAHINPNTAAKIIAALLAEDLLESRPGIGTVVAPLRDSTLRARKDLLGRQVESLVVESKHLAIPREDVLTAIDDHWDRLEPSPKKANTEDRRK